MHKNNFNRGNHLIFLNSVLFFILISLLGYAQSENSLKISGEIEESFQSEFLDIWYPLCIDEKKGGYFSLFTYNWKKGKPQNKMLVTQSRHIWTTSKVALMYPEKKDTYTSYATHGVKFLKEKMWDDKYGGFFMMVDRSGKTLPTNYKDEKRAYGNAFAIYGLAAYYELIKDESALELAQKTFLWMDKNCHDDEFGGYFEQLNRDGSPIMEGDSDLFDKVAFGKKDYNSSIHILEAFTELYMVWPDEHLKKRLTEMLEIVRDKIVTDKGYMLMLFHPNWTYIPFTEYQAPEERKYVFDHVTAGHDVETAFLILEASHVLGLEHDEKTMKKAKLMVEHSVQNLWDNELGGLYDEGYYFDEADAITILKKGKNWWAQAEAMNAFLLMAKLYPDEKDKYFQLFEKQWNYIKTYLIDHENGGWYASGLDEHPEYQKRPKASIWKGTYHNARAMMGCIKMLKQGVE